MAKVLITGVAGFIGMYTARRLCEDGFEVIGIDNLNTYYDVELKLDRLKCLGINTEEIVLHRMYPSNIYSELTFIQYDIVDQEGMESLFKEHQFETVIHLAAQAGIRYSFEYPETYVQVNMVGFFNILELSRKFGITHLIYASSSSVYGENDAEILSTDDRCEQPMNMYAATKKSNELMAYAYSSLYGMHVTGLRFFTVYGPWGRPDMAPMIFAKAIKQGLPIELFNGGEMYRDFTYIDDIVEGIVCLFKKVSESTYTIYNIGNSSPVHMGEFVKVMQEVFGKKTYIINKELQPGEVLRTYADMTPMKEIYGFTPKISIREGLQKFAVWFNDYYGEK